MEIIKELIAVFKPLIELLVITVGPILVTFLVARISKALNIRDEKQKVELENGLRNALHQSAENAIKFAVGRLGLNAALSLDTGRIKPEVLIEAAKYVIDKNPDALKGLGVTADQLRDILTAKAVGLTGSLPDLAQVSKIVTAATPKSAIAAGQV